MPRLFRGGFVLAAGWLDLERYHVKPFIQEILRGLGWDDKQPNLAGVPNAGRCMRRCYQSVRPIHGRKYYEQ